MMALKFNRRIDRVISLCALSGLLVGGLISLCLIGSRQNLEKKKAEGYIGLAEHFGNLLGVVRKSMSDGLSTLVIKSLHFFIAKSLQFRFVPLLQQETSTMSILFWVALSRSVSSMPMDYLQWKRLEINPKAIKAVDRAESMVLRMERRKYESYAKKEGKRTTRAHV